MLSGLSFYLVPKLLASDLILTVDAAASKDGIWPGRSLQNSEFIGGDTFLLPICLRGRDKRAPRLCLCLAVCLHHGHGSRPCPPRPRTPQATAGPLRTEPSPGRPAPSAAPRQCQRLCPAAPALPGAPGTRRSFNPSLATTPIPGLPPVPPPTLPHPPALVEWHHSRWLPVAAVSVAFPAGSSAISPRKSCHALPARPRAFGRTWAASRTTAGFQEKPPLCWKCTEKRDGRGSLVGLHSPHAASK